MTFKMMGFELLRSGCMIQLLYQLHRDLYDQLCRGQGKNVSNRKINKNLALSESQTRDLSVTRQKNCSHKDSRSIPNET